MQESPVLAQVALGYSPLIDRRHEVVGTRLTVFPQRPDAAPDVAALLATLEEVWPRPAGAPGGAPSRPLNPLAEGAAPRAPGADKPVALNVAGEAFLLAVMAALPGGQFMLEVPSFMAAEEANAPLLKALADAGNVLLIKGRPTRPLTAEVLGCFSHSLVDAADDRRSEAGAGTVRQVTTVQSGVRTLADIDAAFKRGAVAAMGWPFDDAVPRSTGRQTVAPDVRVVLDLINGVEREEPVSRLEDLLKREPTIAFRLMRYLNSPAFGLSVEINSFGHALMLLGHQRLKRWLALLLASSSKDPSARVTMFAAVRRGLLMEELARPQNDPELSGEMFICGVFSLLDRLLRQPMAELLTGVPVPERVRLALVGEGGPHLPDLQLVQAIENEAVFDIREGAERLLLGPAEINRAVLAALQSARQLD